MVRVSEGQKELWVGAAHDERVSLSEWIRRRCDAGLGSGEAVMPVPPPVVRAPVSPEPSPARKCVREARHHVNHSGKPCEVCGYPTFEEAVT